MNSEARLNHDYPDGEPIAVIGYACRFPDACDSDAFWANLVAGRECNRQFSRQELLDAGVPAAVIDDPAYVPKGTVVPDADAFDAELFGYSRQEAELIDPQQRLFLQIAWHALEHAGYAPRDVRHKTGVFGAGRISTYPGREAINLAEVAHVRSLQSLMGNDKDYLATRVAYKLDLRGPALTIQTACSSSLVATHMACESLRSGECDMAIAGGVAVAFPQVSGYLYQQGMIFSPDGHCRPFDATAQGTYGGNGVAAVVLRRLADALRDGDPVAAVVLGSATNNDGCQKVGYTAPSVAGQREVIADAWSLAGIQSQQIGMIEAHGTATPLGDPIELQALHALFHARDQGPPCALGSVKSNMGHLDTAAGIASFLKAVLAVEHGTIPPCVNFNQANPSLHLEQGPFHIPTEAQLWDAPVRMAGVSSFGIGGTNCHMVVASLPQALRQPVAGTQAEDADETALILSANTESALQRLAGTYAHALQHLPAADLTYTALQGRLLNLPWRLAVPIGEESVEALTAFAGGQDDILIHAGHGTPGKRIWLFTGQGAQWPGMAQTWCAYSPTFDQCLDRCLAVFDTANDRHFRDNLRKALIEPEHELFQRMEYAQPAIVAFELAMAAHWQAQGLVPDRVLGHSVGEFAAAVVAGHYTLEQVMPRVRLRGALMDRCNGGAMLSVFASEADAMPVAFRHGLDLAAHNGERHLVFSGEQDRVAQMAADLRDMGIRSNPLAVTGAAHSRMLEPILDEFQQAMSGLRAQESTLPLISGLTGTMVDSEQLNDPTFWRRHMRSPVRFIQCLRQAIDDGADVFLEVGPDAPLASIGQREWGSEARWIASARRRQPAARQMRQALMQLFAAGITLPWRSLLSAPGRKCHGPLYPFDRQRYWREAPATLADTSTGQPTSLPLARGVIAREAHALDLPRLRALYSCVVKLHALYVERLVRRCVGERIATGVTALEILHGGRILPRHRQLLIRLLNACVEDGYLQRREDLYAVARAAPHDEHDDLLDELKGYCEGLDVIADTVHRAGESLYPMMNGDVEPVAVIFPEGASRGVEVLYQDFSFGRYFNQIAAGVVADLVSDRGEPAQAPPPYRVLEVGGGTGGTTAWVLPALLDQPNVSYLFTDISPIFTRRAEQKFAAYDFVQYREFDLQKKAAEQGFATGGYDLIIAANVIHATQHVGNTLANLLPLLKPGGKLLMREITRPMRLFDFVFGPLVLPLHDEDARGGELFLTTDRWRDHCLAAGFEQVEWLPEEGTLTANISEHIVLATAPGIAITHTVNMPLSAGPLGLALTDDGSYLADWSDCAGQEAEWLSRISAASAEMAHRHGHGQSVPLPDVPARAPDWLNLVRLQWHTGPVMSARLALSLRRPNGLWHTLTPVEADSPLLSATPDTHYDWVWERVRDAARSSPAFRLRGDASQALAAALTCAGIVLDSQAKNVLVVADPLGPLKTVATSVLGAMTEFEGSRRVVVTRDAWAITEGETVNAVQHALWGLARTAAAEFATQHTDSGIAVIDLAAASDWQDLNVGLQAVANGEPWIAVRHGKIWTPRLVPQQYAAPALTAASLSGKGWHIVTGGLGDLGRLSAKWLRRRGARHIALLSHREHRDSAEFLADLQRGDNCTVACLTCDVADPQALQNALDKLQLDGGIAGVIHAAGVLDDGPIAELDEERLAPVLAVKADAARQIYHALTAAGKDAWLLLYSSAAAALGATGQAAHALASAYLDGLAHASSARKGDCCVRVMSVAWGAWGESGWAAQAGLPAHLASQGMGVLSDAEGLWHLEQAIARAAPYRLAARVLPESLDTARSTFFALKQPADAASPANAETKKKGAVAADSPAIQLTDPAAVAHWLTAQVAAQLRLDDHERLSHGRDLVQLGLDSLLFLELSSSIQRHLGVRIDAEKAYRDLTISGLSHLIAAQASEISPETVSVDRLKHDAAGRFRPFPLTPIQHAYWMGRTHLIDFGGVACHVLFEWDLRHDPFDLVRLEQAWNALIHRHDMLRIVIDAEGQQRVLAEVPDYPIARRNLMSLPHLQRQKQLEETRRELSYRVLPTDRWPLFELIVSEWDEGLYRLHMNLDLLLFDVQSLKVMMDDLAMFYRGETPEPLQITFRDYVLDEQARRLTPEWLKSWCYWQTLLADLPPAPRLPLSEKRFDEQLHFTTYQAVLDQASWARLKREWQSWGVTPSAALMTLFAWTLERWARWPAFTLNLTFFNRRQVHPQMQRMIGDFTSVLLVDFDLSDTSVSLRHTIEQTQQRLRQHLAHSQVNGVELLRELGRQRGQSRQPLMPVVFTSMLGMTLEGLSIDQAMTRLLGDPVHVFTQTPQVWLDHQVMEIEGELVFSWYCMDEVLAEGTAQAMFKDFQGVLHAVAHDPALMARNDLWQQSENPQNPLRIARRRWPATIAGTTVDLREIEDTVRQQNGVLWADVRAEKQGDTESEGLRVNVVASARSLDLTRHPSLSLDNLGLAGLGAVEQACFDAVWHALEAQALQGIAATLVNQDLFVRQGQAVELNEIYQHVKTLPQFERIVRQWLHALLRAGWLARNGQVFVCQRPLIQMPEAQVMPSTPWGDALSAYLDRSIARHAELLQGTCSALELFFADDHAVTRSLYAENPAARCVIRNVERIVRALAATVEPREKWQVMEVGAGTGATTGAVLQGLDQQRLSYHYTDVSTFFLDDARARFATRDDIVYALFDINQPVDYSLHPVDGYDLVVAAQVMHDASHIVRSLKRIASLMKPDARLLLIEATHQDSQLQMASVGFIEGLGNYQDHRLIDDRAMLALSQWREALMAAGLAFEQAWPQEDVSPLHQHVIIARLTRAAHIDCAELEQILTRCVNPAVPILTVQQREPLSLFAMAESDGSKKTVPEGNGNTHRALPAAGKPPAEFGQQPDAALLHGVAQVWQSFLGKPVQASSDFFQCGGDSLIATRIVAQLNRNGIVGANLQALFAHPTLGGFCATLNNHGEKNRDNVLVPLSQSSSGETAFVFHASDGGVTSYLTLAPALTGQVWGLQAPESVEASSLLALAEGYLHAMPRQPKDQPYTLIGWSYGATVAAEVARLLHAREQCVRLVLIDPVCGADFAVGNLSELMSLLAREHNIALPDDWSRWEEVARIDAFVSLAGDAGFIQPSLSTDEAHRWLMRIYRLLDLLSHHQLGACISVPVLWIQADQSPEHWRPAEHQWLTWKAAAQTHLVHATHGQLMADSGVAEHVAAIIAQWRRQTSCQEKIQ